MCEGLKGLLEDSRLEGETRGEAIGENLVVTLASKLYSLGRDDDVKKAMEDSEFREKLYIELGIKQEQT